MKKRALIIGLAALLLLGGCAPIGNTAMPSYRQISMEEAVTLMQTESNYIILDVRRPDEFAVGHIPHAINLPNEEIGADAPALLPDKEQLILIYCRSGNRSKQAAEKLARLGYTNLVEFGGILDWTGITETTEIK